MGETLSLHASSLYRVVVTNLILHARRAAAPECGVWT